MEVKESQKKEGLYDKTIEDFIKIYNETKTPIEVSFREINPSLNNSDRATHLIHTYPAKLLPHIPHLFLNSDIFSSKGGVVLDPFCGSGTVLLEAMLAERNAIGADSNPLARLITKVKTTNYNVEKLELTLERILGKFYKVESFGIPNVINVDHWFHKETKDGLGRLFCLLTEISDNDIRDFFLVCFSNCVKKVSLADPRVSVPVRLRYDQYKDGHPLKEKTRKRLESLQTVNVLEKFEQISRENIRRFRSLEFSNGIKSRVVSVDARLISESIDDGSPRAGNSVDLVITSPPYGGAQKYIRASSMNLGWLGELDGRSLVELEQKSIGRENYKAYEFEQLVVTNIYDADQLLKEIRKENPIRAHISGNYLVEMEQALREVYRVLKNGGFFILVSANNQVAGRQFQTQEYLRQICVKIGFDIVLELVDDIKSYGLMTKRNKTASMITREWVVIFRK